MSPYSIIPVFFALFVAWLVSLAFRNLSNENNAHGRQSSLDGLRGYLAFFVFLHHSSLHFEYGKTDVWEGPPSHLYAHLGDSSVKLFFMITGFLFFSKLLRGKSNGKFDWVGLYAGRFCRIVPLYWSAIGALLVVVMVSTDFRLHQPVLILIAKILNWLNFVFTTQPDLNDLLGTKLVLAGVIWTLVVEWMFYLFLPMLALVLGIRVERPFLFLLIIPLTWGAVFIGFKTFSTLVTLVPFLGGILAAYVNHSIRNNLSIQNYVKGNCVSTLIVVALVANVVVLPDGRNFVTPVLLAIAFVPIACGNNIFGILNLRFARYMGEISYSIYLLHGLVLYVTFRMLMSAKTRVSLSPEQHWAIVVILVPVLLLICTFTFRQIESRGIAMTPRLTSKLSKLKLFRSPLPTGVTGV